jgi:hypothetical protein
MTENWRGHAQIGHAVDALGISGYRNSSVVASDTGTPLLITVPVGFLMILCTRAAADGVMAEWLVLLVGASSPPVARNPLVLDSSLVGFSKSDGRLVSA